MVCNAFYVPLSYLDCGKIPARTGFDNSSPIIVEQIDCTSRSTSVFCSNKSEMALSLKTKSGSSFSKLPSFPADPSAICPLRSSNSPSFFLTHLFHFDQEIEDRHCNGLSILVLHRRKLYMGGTSSAARSLLCLASTASSTVLIERICIT